MAQIAAWYCWRGELRAIGGGKAAWGNGEEFQLFPQNGEYGETNFTAEKALALMDRHEVERAVLMQGSMYGFQNRYHSELIRRYPDRFCPTCTVDPFMTDAVQTMEYFFEKQGFRAAKFEVSSGGGLMGCHEPFRSGRSCDAAAVRHHRSPQRPGGAGCGDLTMPSHQPWSLPRIAEDHPHIKLVVCHLLAPMPGRKKEWTLSLELLKKPNVWFDIAALPKIMAPDVYPYPMAHQALQLAKSIVGADRLLWGTDAPFAATQDSYEHLTDYLTKGDAFTSEELADVYYNNAKRVYFDN